MRRKRRKNTGKKRFHAKTCIYFCYLPKILLRQSTVRKIPPPEISTLNFSPIPLIQGEPGSAYCIENGPPWLPRRCLFSSKIHFIAITRLFFRVGIPSRRDGAHAGEPAVFRRVATCLSMKRKFEGHAVFFRVKRRFFFGAIP